jgi:hypothetical protein
MMNRKICERCYTKRFSDASNFPNLFGRDWDKAKIVNCPPIHVTQEYCDVHKIDGPLPENCPYVLEHIVNAK